MLYFIAFILGSGFGVVLMCLLQINRLEADIGQSPAGSLQLKEGGRDEQQSQRA